MRHGVKKKVIYGFFVAVGVEKNDVRGVYEISCYGKAGKSRARLDLNARRAVRLKM